MLLRDEIKRLDLTLEEAAAQLGTSAPVLSRATKRVPRPDLVVRIYVWSGGRVDPNSFYALPALDGAALRPDGKGAAGGAAPAGTARARSRVVRSVPGGKPKRRRP